MILQNGDRGSLVAIIQEKIGVKADGIFGSGTESALRFYQAEKGLRADGIAGTGTFLAMGIPHFSKYIKNGTDKNVSWELPVSGKGFRTYNRESRGDQFGTKEVIEKCIEIAEKWNCMHPEVDIQFGDISYLYGGRTPDHSTHRTGKDVDIRPIRKDGKYLPVEYTHAEYSRDLSREFLLLVKPYVRGVYFNDPVLIKEGLCSYSRNHNNHFHLMF